MERGLPRVAVEEPAAGNDGGLLRARADQLAHGYEERAAEAEAAALRWRWATATSGHGDVEPLRLERMGGAPGRWLHRPPPPWQEHEAIGFDALGRVVCVRQYDATGEVWLGRVARWGGAGGGGRGGGGRVRRRAAGKPDPPAPRGAGVGGGGAPPPAKKPVESER